MTKQSDKHDIAASAGYRDVEVTSKGIRAQLDRVLSSPDFKAPKKVKTIFRYLTEETLSGREDQLNAGTIANKAQNRPLNPEPPIDPLIRIQLNQLRRALKSYDAATGATDADFRIDVPENRYTPVFHSKDK